MARPRPESPRLRQVASFFNFRLYIAFAHPASPRLIMQGMENRKRYGVLPQKLLSGRSGAAASEFAIVAPLFLLLMLGMIAYGIYFGASHSIQQIAADAARTAIAGLNQAERQQLVAGFISRNVSGYAFVDPGKLTVEARDRSHDGNQFEVQVSYEASHLPIWNLLAGLAMPDTTITRSSTIRIGGI
jgi:Flp pilus assembly protein TadG